MFEIILKQDYEDIFFFRDFEINGVNNNSNGGSPARNSSLPRDISISKISGGRSRSPPKYSFHSSSKNLIVTSQ